MDNYDLYKTVVIRNTDWKAMHLGEWEHFNIEQTMKVRRRIMDSTGTLGFPGHLVDKIQPGVVVHTDRGMGKSKALLWTIYERHQGDALLVVKNGQQERRLIDTWQEMFQQQELWLVVKPKIVATTAFIGRRSLEHLSGHSRAVYCDDWWGFLPETQQVLRESGRVAGAVGMMHNNAKDVDVIPL